jgi:acyl-CoA thioester hydrolase
MMLSRFQPIKFLYSKGSRKFLPDFRFVSSTKTPFFDTVFTDETNSSKYLLTGRAVVHPWHCDHMGHMNVMHYVNKFDDASWNLFTYLSLTPAYLHAQNKGLAGVQQNITYKKELFPGDTIAIRSKLLEITSKKLVFQHEMIKTDDNTISAIMVLTGVHLDKGTRKSVALPDEVMKRAQSLLTK